MSLDILKELKEIAAALADLRITTALNRRDLEEHMRRTEILESHVDQQNKELIKLKSFFMLIGWGFGALATLVTVGIQLYRAFYGI